MTQKECIGVKFTEGPGIFNDHYKYPIIDTKEEYNSPIGKLKDIQGHQAHACHNFFFLEGNKLSFDIDECPDLHIAIRADKGTNTCLLLSVRDKKPREHLWRPVVIGKTVEGDPGIYEVVRDCFGIKDDGEWHEYDFDLRKIRQGYPDAGGVCVVEFYSWRAESARRPTELTAAASSIDTSLAFHEKPHLQVASAGGIQGRFGYIIIQEAEPVYY